MAFGIPSSQDLSGLVTQLQAALQADEAKADSIVSDVITQLSGHAAALEQQTAKDVLAIEQPIVAELAALRGELAAWRTMAQTLIDRTTKAAGVFGA